MYNKYDSFVAIDFETASSAYYSACAIGIVKVVGKEIVAHEYFLIQPPNNYYDDDSIAIHGITSNDTENSDVFPEVWKKIKHYFVNSYIVAYNANFDMSVLKAAMNYYNIKQVSFPYFDVMHISGLFMDSENKKNRSLKSRCEYYAIELDNHHNALFDAKACARLVLCALEDCRYNSISTFLQMRGHQHNFDDVKQKKLINIGGHRHIKIKDIVDKINTETSNYDDDFKDKNFVFTGQLLRLTREEAYSRVISGGGTIKSGVSSKTDVLVNADTDMTTKLKKALELQSKGHHIKIVTDSQFMEMLESLEAVVL